MKSYSECSGQNNESKSSKETNNVYNENNKAIIKSNKINKNVNISLKKEIKVINIIQEKNEKKVLQQDNKKNSSKNPSQKIDENNYSNYIWVTGNIIKREKLKNFNPFEDEGKKILELQQYIFELQKKLEKKEESISKLDYKNKKLNEQIQNNGIIKIDFNPSAYEESIEEK